MPVRTFCALNPTSFFLLKLYAMPNDWVELLDIRRIRGGVGHSHSNGKFMGCRRLLRSTCVGTITSATPILVLDTIAPGFLQEVN